jgi:hypothetical protein
MRHYSHMNVFAVDMRAPVDAALAEDNAIRLTVRMTEYPEMLCSGLWPRFGTAREQHRWRVLRIPPCEKIQCVILPCDEEKPCGRQTGAIRRWKRLDLDGPVGYAASEILQLLDLSKEGEAA